MRFDCICGNIILTTDKVIYDSSKRGHATKQDDTCVGIP